MSACLAQLHVAHEWAVAEDAADHLRSEAIESRDGASFSALVNGKQIFVATSDDDGVTFLMILCRRWPPCS
jgi:hypothetical protein